MRTVKEEIKVKFTVTGEDLIDNRYIPYVLLSDMLKQKEINEKIPNEKLRMNLYNMHKGNKFNEKVIARMVCIDVKEPMKEGKSSLVLEFEVKK